MPQKGAPNLGPEVKRIIHGFKMISLEKWVNIKLCPFLCLLKRYRIVWKETD
jgi:hypothetical protein